METVVAVVACAIALGLGYFIGSRATFGQPFVSLAGLVIGEVCAFVYFGASNWAGRMWAGSLDPRRIGTHFMILVFAAGVCGLVGAWLGYRKTMGRGLF